jgi:hypothetical protein
MESDNLPYVIVGRYCKSLETLNMLWRWHFIYSTYGHKSEFCNNGPELRLCPKSRKGVDMLRKAARLNTPYWG